jgi:DNA-binding response OmpR family regulator
MAEVYERGAIVVVDPGRTGERPDGPDALVEHLRRVVPPADDGAVAVAVTRAPPDQLVDLLADAVIGAVVVDLRGGPATWTRVRALLLARHGAVSDDVPLLLVADEATWPRVLEVLAAGRGDGLALPCADAEMRARLRGVTGPRRTRDAERSLLARAIHDDSLQILAAVAMRLQLLRRQAAPNADDPPDGGTTALEDAALLDEVIVDLGDALERLRTLEMERHTGAPRPAPAPAAEAPGRPATEAPDESADAGSSPFEVLYIEDNPASLRLVERILRRRPGVTMIPAMLGRLGVQLAVQRQPAMVLVDLHLPDMSGSEVVRVLANGDATRHIPVVVMSANAVRPQDRDPLVEGAHAYLTKPFPIQDLLALVDDVRGGPGGSPDRVGHPGTAAMSDSGTEAREPRP